MIASTYGWRMVLREGKKITQRWYYIPDGSVANVLDCVGEWRDEAVK